MTEYERIANKIIEKAIKSAVFIDENAKEPYSPDDHEPSETQRTKELYDSFREVGISLSVYQYNEKNYNTNKDFIFSNRDLVLLDWMLEGDESDGKKSLEILSEIVKEHKHIQFCVIYTQEKEDNILKDILSYFSNTTKQEVENLQNDLLEFEDEIKSVDILLGQLLIQRFNSDESERIKSTIQNKDSSLIPKLSEITHSDDDIDLLIKCYLAFNHDLIIPDVRQPSPSSIDTTTHTLCLHNTIVTIVNKDSVSPKELFKKFGNTISTYQWGAMQLVGLEMKNIQNNKCSFIDNHVLEVSKEALGYHKHKKAEEFDFFLKSVMIEQLSTNLRNVKVSLLDAIETTEPREALYHEYVAMNVFYNSVKVEGDKSLSFGDVFRCKNEKTGEYAYFICITALCDCAHPKNNRFYFAKGEKEDIKKALKIGDSGFISFLDTETCIKWNQSSKHGPTYIIPEQYIVPNNIIINNEIEVRKLRIGVRKGNNVDKYLFEYITTIKQNYAQRIANHAFMYPIRVGIDFVKI